MSEPDACCREASPSMPLTFQTPQVVRTVVDAALRMHRAHPIHDVGGVSVAEALASGPVAPETVAKMRRFFVVNERHYLHEAGLSRHAINSPLMRSWELYGGHVGKTWADVTYCQARQNGFIEEDPWVTLLKLRPSEVYERFAFNAWRWEYDLTPQRAARFVEEYHRSTGLNLDIASAFGTGRNAVSEAMIRRAQNTNPFALLARALVRDAYRKAATQDMIEVKAAIGKPALNWPTLIGYTVLASRAPAAAKLVVEGTPAPPLVGGRPEPLMLYSEPVAAYVAYFHPRGPRWKPNTPTGLLGEMADLMQRAWAGRPIVEEQAREVLSKGRYYTGGNALAWNLGHTLLEAWKRREWEILLEAIPLDSPVRHPFEQHVGVRTRL